MGLAVGVGDSSPGAWLCVGLVARTHLTHDHLCVLVLPSSHLRGQMGSLELGVPRDTLEPKVMREQEGSMGPQDPLVYR